MPSLRTITGKSQLLLKSKATKSSNKVMGYGHRKRGQRFLLQKPLRQSDSNTRPKSHYGGVRFKNGNKINRHRLLPQRRVSQNGIIRKTFILWFIDRALLRQLSIQVCLSERDQKSLAASSVSVGDKCAATPDQPFLQKQLPQVTVSPVRGNTTKFHHFQNSCKNIL